MSHPITRSLLLGPVLDAYSKTDAPVDNATVYTHVDRVTGTDSEQFISPVGKANMPVNTWKRGIRWGQQTLKQAGMIENVGYGQWRITKSGKQTLTEVSVNKHMVAASTELGVAIWGNSVNVFDRVITEPCHLCLTSSPYLGIVRSYGTHFDEQDYIDFILSVIEPIRKKMVPGASLALNVTNDSVLRKQFGVRSRYLERLVLALGDKLDLHLMDRLIWEAKDKPPRGHQVTHKRTHLVSRYEPILWFCAEPEHCLADNRRVLKGYTPTMQALIERGGESRAYQGYDYDTPARKGSFSNDNGGTIPSNVLSFPTYCAKNRAAQKAARALSLPVHGALYPVALADFLIRWLCPEAGFVVDPFGGYSTSGLAAQMNGRRWATCELHWEYVRAAVERFTAYKGYYINPLMLTLEDTMTRHRFAAA